MRKLEAHEVALHKVFCADYDFRIPRYQRPYAWEVEQAEQLLADLDDALQRDGDEPYFLGSIVLVKEADKAAAEVIDGQQRLTTLTILLAVLRDLTDDGELRGELARMIAEPGSKMLALEPKPRLTLREKDSDFFRKHVQDDGATSGLDAVDPSYVPTDAQRAVIANASALRRRLATWTEEQRLALTRMLSQRTFLVIVRTPDLVSAHRIFSVMNSRGLDLSPADIFKSLVIGDLEDDPKAAEMCAAHWEDAEEALGRADFADLFMHLRMVFVKERAKVELLKEFDELVLKKNYLPGRAKEFVTEVLDPYAAAYGVIRDFDYSAPAGAEKVNAWLRRLDQLDNSDWIPPALWALKEHPNDPVWLDHFFRALERLAASMFVRRIYTTPRLQRYEALLKELAAGHGLDAPAFRLDDEERQATRDQLDGDIYREKKTRRYVLLRLDEVLADASGAVYVHPLVTVEHVLPQNPTPGSQWLTDFTDDERELWTHRLGNLVLLTRRKNSEAQNYDFTVKKAKYFGGKHGTTTFALTGQVLAAEQWTPAHLKERQEYLVTRLCEEWGL
ncbi:DUF262 domain-containing protein [Yinghuangia soli]|uniref:DUF262 domain-containing HNH endonuclease family protein n=1 Tax=Yinghuangia soli TaxID=2908204 RepID=A0AA41PUU9_9ACTN|nr:DUF262 domain-containing protein [Yinghuangia soli]MCF2526279.1 DUF262 domain-containing HNH endonuclease family protein [Yinghuangia soli]